MTGLDKEKPRFKWSEWGSPPGQGGAPEAEMTQQPAVGELWEMETLSEWGARYTEKKARREVLNSSGSDRRILRSF